MTDEEMGASQPTYLVTERLGIDVPSGFSGYDPHKFEIVPVETPREEQEQGLRRFAVVIRAPDELTSAERAKIVAGTWPNSNGSSKLTRESNAWLGCSHANYRL